LHQFSGTNELKRSLGSLKNQIIEVGKRAYAHGYIAANDGNISARINKNHVLITPTGISKGFMKTSDLIVVDMNGKIVAGKKKPSSEIQMHLQIYKERMDINGVCHLHPPYATGFAVARIPLDRYILTEAEITLGNIPLIEYAMPGTEELSHKIIPFLRDSHAFLLANHGALTVGTNIFKAYNAMETLEHAAHIIFIARQLGNLNSLNEEQVKKLAVLREK
jgi:L-fuculose-phosphate aldolase